jgi:5-(carboxyamino)imidazole ribonucleotide synthase
MVNLLGDLWETDTPEWADAVTATSALHLYGKSAARSGRKMGHLTAWGATVAEAEVRALDARRALSSG